MIEPEALSLDADRLAAQLEAIFDQFSGRNEAVRETRQKEKRGIAGLFRGWFSTSPGLEPEQQRFLDDAEALSLRLAEALSRLPEGDARQEIAARAVTCFLSPKPPDDKTPEEWFMTAAEYLCAPLLPYLSRPALERAHDGILSRTHRRFLFPKQLELIEQMEALLGGAQ